MRLKDRVAIVTGGANGIGAAISRRYLAEGASVAIVDRQQADLSTFGVSPVGADIAFFECDVTSGPDVESTCAAILERFGKASILVNNAGGSGQTLAQEIEDNTDEVWHHVMDLNITAIIRFSRHLVPSMRREKFGRIINMSSTARHGHVLRGPAPTIRNHIGYATAKGAMVSLSSQLGKQLGVDGITCNAISPGMIWPDPDARITKLMQGAGPEFVEALIAGISVKRVGTGPDVAGLAAYLASDEAGFINGETIEIDGGT